MNIIFNGRTFAQKKEELLKSKISLLLKKLGRKPKLVAVGIGDEKDINLYISMKEKAAQRLGINFEKKVFPADISENEVLEFVKKKNQDQKVDGILLELPIPKNFSVINIMQQVSSEKDPDCMTVENLGRLLYGNAKLFPATVKAILEIIDVFVGDSTVIPAENELLSLRGVPSETREDEAISISALAGIASPASPDCNDTNGYISLRKKPLSYKNVLVVGGGIELGKPLAMVLSDLGAAVSLCRSTTRDLTDFTKNADIIISAVGKPKLIRGDMVKEGVVAIDAGINLVNGKTEGDVDFDSVAKKASFLTPVPGGVGPVTIVALFENLLSLSSRVRPRRTRDLSRM